MREDGVREDRESHRISRRHIVRRRGAGDEAVWHEDRLTNGLACRLCVRERSE